MSVYAGILRCAIALSLICAGLAISADAVVSSSATGASKPTRYVLGESVSDSMGGAPFYPATDGRYVFYAYATRIGGNSGEPLLHVDRLDTLDGRRIEVFSLADKPGSRIVGLAAGGGRLAVLSAQATGQGTSSANTRYELAIMRSDGSARRVVETVEPTAVTNEWPGDISLVTVSRGGRAIAAVCKSATCRTSDLDELWAYSLTGTSRLVARVTHAQRDSANPKFSFRAEKIGGGTLLAEISRKSYTRVKEIRTLGRSRLVRRFTEDEQPKGVVRVIDVDAQGRVIVATKVRQGSKRYTAVRLYPRVRSERNIVLTRDRNLESAAFCANKLVLTFDTPTPRGANPSETRMNWSAHVYDVNGNRVLSRERVVDFPHEEQFPVKLARSVFNQTAVCDSESLVFSQIFEDGQAISEKFHAVRYGSS